LAAATDASRRLGFGRSLGLALGLALGLGLAFGLGIRPRSPRRLGLLFFCGAFSAAA